MQCDSLRRDSVEALFLDLGGLADAITQVVELGPTNIAASGNFDFLDHGSVDGEGPLHANAEADLANGECLANPAPLASDDDAFEELGAMAVAFNDLYVHLQGVAGREVRNVVA